MIKCKRPQTPSARSTALMYLTMVIKMKKIICLVGVICLTGCVVSEKEVVHRKISFADTNSVTTVYYPSTWDKFVKAPDDGTAKTMLGSSYT